MLLALEMEESLDEDHEAKRATTHVGIEHLFDRWGALFREEGLRHDDLGPAQGATTVHEGGVRQDAKQIGLPIAHAQRTHHRAQKPSDHLGIDLGAAIQERGAERARQHSLEQTSLGLIERREGPGPPREIEPTERRAEHAAHRASQDLERCVAHRAHRARG